MDMPAQPDFDAIATGFATLSDQFGRCVNLPAVQQGNEVLQALLAIGAQLDQMETRSEGRFSNLSAQLQNQHVTRADQRLVKMRDVTTNTEIPGAPQTLGEIDELSGKFTDMIRIQDDRSGSDRDYGRQEEAGEDSMVLTHGTLPTLLRNSPFFPELANFEQRVAALSMAENEGADRSEQA
ncbi:hypothetical protein UCREL1_3757 [Eutypa lata UCREL1]|uniref:Uncharacterized protein n=1 Tax=Eutypa lata (strain UCR-EL1) TaxID=1287681 RepID=M7TH29_EUTLA|nr:hypothetical protein UCREL1_3757 [Eutypa lata UCREL1]